MSDELWKLKTHFRYFQVIKTKFSRNTWLGPASLVKSLSFSLPQVTLLLSFLLSFVFLSSPLVFLFLSSFSVLRCTPFNSCFLLLLFYFFIFCSSSQNIFGLCCTPWPSKDVSNPLKKKSRNKLFKLQAPPSFWNPLSFLFSFYLFAQFYLFSLSWKFLPL